ncbi:aspartate/glutamate racemase family protein [Rhizobium sp. NZLR1]|uniref:aspartate/glutamate racemase family protein n=1 Tax=Rhizobium sp. NZLR1 TaxID=2731096 RepID=UPI001A990271|nr:aspartate/glutamate racemase family protein [Rhizobium sp. NZLR1]MBX5204107.1 hydantoin racemase [Rhizobium sp. NZLR1]QSZ25101.1 hydantoin racemase [Rhizobium sp. NZLR1]
MPRRINFINPFGTTAYDDLIQETLTHYAMQDTQLEVTHLEGCPADMDYFYPKHMVEAALFEAVRKSEEDGFDAVIVGCCYDPGVMVSRELVNIPVIGPFEASLNMLSFYGRTAVIVADHVKAGSQMKDNVKLYGASDRILGLDVIDWYVKDMVLDTSAVAHDVVEQTAKSIERTGAEAVILNCTIIAASYQKFLMDGGEPAPFPILNPNLMALGMAETLANLYQKGNYHVSRLGYYGQPKDPHFQAVTEVTRQAWRNAKPNLVSSYIAE